MLQNVSNVTYFSRYHEIDNTTGVSGAARLTRSPLLQVSGVAVGRYFRSRGPQFVAKSRNGDQLRPRREAQPFQPRRRNAARTTSTQRGSSPRMCLAVNRSTPTPTSSYARYLSMSRSHWTRSVL